MNKDANNEKPKEMTAEGIKNIIEKSGYSLEIDVANTLRDYYWWTFSQHPYFDKSEKKIKLIDVVSEKRVAPSLWASLLIECKKSTQHGWAFYTKQKFRDWQSVKAQFSDYMLRFEGFNHLETHLAFEKKNPHDQFHVTRMETKIGTLCCIPPKHPDDFHEACQQLVSGLRGLREELQKRIFFPVIVFDGPMWEFYKESAKLKINEIDYLQYLSAVLVEDETYPCLIDVVKSSYFPNFLQLVNGTLRWLKSAAKTNKP